MSKDELSLEFQDLQKNSAFVMVEAGSGIARIVEDEEYKNDN